VERAVVWFIGKGNAVLRLHISNSSKVCSSTHPSAAATTIREGIRQKAPVSPISPPLALVHRLMQPYQEDSFLGVLGVLGGSIPLLTRD
jgi:hypothetical protein